MNSLSGSKTDPGACAASAASRTTDTETAAQATTPSLRLLFVVDGWFPAIGGAELQALKLAKALGAKGVSVEFVAPYLDRSMPLQDEVEGFPLTKITYPQIKLLGSALLNLRFAWWLWRRQKDFDSVHIHITQTMAATAGFVRPFLKIPLVTKVSGFFEFEKGVLSPRQKYNPLLWLMRMGLRNVDYVQTISTQTQQKLLDAGFTLKQIQTIPNGIQLCHKPRERVWKTGDELVIGYCGRLQPVKGVDVLIRGFAGLLKLQPHLDTRLLLAGGGAMEAPLKQLANELGISDKVQFQGIVRDVAGFLAQCDIYVQPSHAEGLPNSVLEAMNACLPTVASAVGGNLDLLQDGVNGYLFPAGDSAALAERLSRFTRDDRLLRSMGENGRATVTSGYGFESVTNRLMELYNHDR